MISLLSCHIFSSPIVKGRIEEEEIELRNLSKEKHIEYYRNKLGLRKYIANDKRHKFDRENPYEKGKLEAGWICMMKRHRNF